MSGCRIGTHAYAQIKNEEKLNRHKSKLRRQKRHSHDGEGLLP